MRIREQYGKVIYWNIARVLGILQRKVETAVSRVHIFFQVMLYFLYVTLCILIVLCRVLAVQQREPNYTTQTRIYLQKNSKIDDGKIADMKSKLLVTGNQRSFR